MKTKKYIGCALLASALGGFSACSDYKDWNNISESDSTNPEATQTLWESISNKAELSDFARVLNKVNMAEQLNASRFYTVWAPVNGSFNVDSVLQCSDDAIKLQFVNHHIAEYNHLAKANLDEKVTTLDKKSQPFAFSDGQFVFNNASLATTDDNKPLYNIPALNGTLHMMKGNSAFLPNGMEALSMIDGIKEVSDYILSYNDTTLDTRSSVPGPIVNGKQTYLDSVFTITNTLTTRLRARIDSEDSTYTILLPTDDAYKTYYDKVKNFFAFQEMKWQDVTSTEKTSGYTEYTITENTSSSTQIAVGVTFAYLKDSLTKRQIINNMFYSNNNKYNMHLVSDAENFNDTVFTTSRDKLSHGDLIFDPTHIVQKEKLSNGWAFVTDELNFQPWETYNPPIEIPGPSRCRVTGDYLNSTNVFLTEENINKDLVTLEPGQDMLYYCWAQAKAKSKPEVDFYLNGVKATTYNVYCVIPPANIDLRDKTTEVLPNILNFEYQGYYKNSAGRATYGKFSFTNVNFVPNTPVEGGTAKLQNTDFVNDVTKVDTMLLGQISFPYSYYGLGHYPNIKVTSSARISTLQPKVLANYTRDIRIIALILRPLDYEEYLEQQKNNK